MRSQSVHVEILFARTMNVIRPTELALSARYAIYFAPDPTSELWRFGSEVLGYDAASGSDCLHPASGDLDWARITDEPRRYGFHATLKAPFSLAAGRSEAGLIEAAERFASSQPVFHLPRLRLDALGSFPGADPCRTQHLSHRSSQSMRRSPSSPCAHRSTAPISSAGSRPRSRSGSFATSNAMATPMFSRIFAFT